MKPMHKWKQITIVATLYVINILFFAGYYYYYWIVNPSNFIVNEQFNEKTLNPFFSYRDLPDKNMTFNKELTALEANMLIRPYNDTILVLSHSQQILEKILTENKFLDSLNHEKIMASFGKNQVSYLNNLLVPYIKKKDSIKRQINLLNQKQQKQLKSSDSYFYFTEDKTIAFLNILLTINDNIITNTKNIVHENIKKSIPSAYNDSLFLISKLIFCKIDSLEKGKWHIQKDISDKKEKVWHIASYYYVNRIHKLVLSDFLYFSIITASTTGYGDILPNSSYIRNLVSIEIMFSLFLFGFLFYFIAKPTKDKQE